jgi:aromatic ring-opening dioxygenase catalytic subunit (LigB family)
MGTLIMGSGNIVHNLQAFRRYQENFAHPWAVQFIDYVRESAVGRSGGIGQALPELTLR